MSDVHPISSPPETDGADASGPLNWTHSAFFRTHAPRLEALIRGRLSPRFRSRFDADDIVQSAFRSFFLGQPSPSSPLSKESDLWPLLTEIAVRKLAQQIRRHQAQRRNVTADVPLEDIARSTADGPDEAAGLAEIITLVQNGLDEPSRMAFTLRLQGFEILEIAETRNISERTVRRQLTAAKERLLKLLDRDAAEALAEQVVQPTDEPSTVLRFNDYRLHQWVGDGASGNVYRATEKATGQMLAIKFLKKRFLFHPQSVATFLREIQVVSRLQHPGILAIRGLGKTPNRGFFLVMDWAPGGDLAWQVTAQRLELQQIRDWTEQLVAALAHAHQQEVIHCDLKPSNVLIGNQGQLQLCDFGLARQVAGRSDQTFGTGGTPAFIAPELVQPSFGEVGPWTDVFGIGAIVFNLLTGRPPHAGGTIDGILNCVVRDSPVDWPATTGDAIPPDWRAFCDGLLAKRVTDRCPNMASVQQRLAKLSSPPG